MYTILYIQCTQLTIYFNSILSIGTFLKKMYTIFFTFNEHIFQEMYII